MHLTRLSFGLGPNRQLSQYVSQRWGTESDFPSGPVHAITQTGDGYLWIGTDSGLVRFDGFGFRSFPLTPNIADPNTPVVGLTTDSDGNLLIQPQGLGMLRQKNGKFETVETGLATSEVTAIFRERDGGVLFSDLLIGTLRLLSGKVQLLVPVTLAGTTPVMAMAESPNGTIWIGTLNSGLFSFHDGKTTKVGGQLPHTKINCVLPANGDEVWLGTDSGAFRWDGSKFSHLGLPAPFDDAQILSFLRDRDSNVWIGTARGLLRMNPKSVSRWDEGQFPIGAVNALFEDREGNIWVGGTRGLERIRDSAFLTYSTATGLPSDQTGPIYVDRQNRTWFAPIEGGLYLLTEGKVRPVKVPGMNTDVVYSIHGGNDGSIWIGRQNGGITRLRFANGVITHQTFTEAQGLAQNSVYSIYQARDGSVWAGTLSGGVSQLKNGRFVTYTAANGLGANTVASILETQDGTMWFATPNGLSTFSHGQWKTYTRANGLPSENVNCLYQDSSGILWIGTSGGLAFFGSGQISIPGTASASLREEIFGIAEDWEKGLWIATSHHVFRAQSEQLLSNASGPGDVREYWVEDGLLGLGGVKRNVSVIADFSQRIWFSLSRGLSVVNASQATRSLTPAIAHIEAILEDGKPTTVLSGVRIPSSHKRVTFSFTGLSLAVPEHVRFRYMLDPFDRGWSEPVATREAVYTNLSPGAYRFRLIASNSAGVWNGVETNLSFEVAPAVWETWWFRLLGIAAVGSLIVFLYRLRLHSLTRQLNVRFEERLAERTRIAQELHDTLLQGVVSGFMQLNVANDRLESNSPAKPLVTRVLELMNRVVDDGRDALHGLRLSTGDTQDLGQAFSRIPEDLLVQDGANFRVVVEGSSRLLHPVIRDEVYRIGREAVANSLRHSRAQSIEVGLEYGRHELRVIVRDDGCGIDPKVLTLGREGHWGLSGMRERAEKIGAKLSVWSNAGRGTEVDLRIPGRIAFQSNKSSKLAGWLSFARKARLEAKARYAKPGQK